MDDEVEVVWVGMGGGARGRRSKVKRVIGRVSVKCEVSGRGREEREKGIHNAQ